MTFSARLISLACFLILSACGAATSSRVVGLTSTTAALDDAASGVHDEALAALLREHWEATLRENPVLGTMIGDHRRDSELPDMSPDAERERRRVRADFLVRARALSPRDAGDRVTLALFIDSLDAEAGSEICESHLWNASPMENPIVILSRIAPLHVLDTPAAGRDYLARLRAYPAFTDRVAANLVEGSERGWIAPRTTLERVAQLARSLPPIERWVAYLAPGSAVQSWPVAERDAFMSELHRVLAEEVQPGFVRYAETIERLVPLGRDAAHEGVSSLPHGAECYAAEIRRHTTAVRSAEELHRLGLEEIAGTDARLVELGGRAFGLASVAEVLAHLRADPSLGYASGDDIIADASARIREAEARAPEFFSRRAETACEVRPVPEAEAGSGGFAYYMPGATDGSRAGAYYVNTAEPASRRRHLVAAVTAHEAVPGHHFQITVAQTLPAMPAFRRYGSFTAYVEGWGLYAERLADEMGLYRDDIDRLGAVDLEAFRAARLVVDTGLHAMGWTRADAEAYLAEHTSMSPDLIVNEVDRYINWPGQALAYKVGQLAILAARARAEEAMGEHFDARDFHDRVLGLGPMSLQVFEEAMRESR